MRRILLCWLLAAAGSMAQEVELPEIPDEVQAFLDRSTLLARSGDRAAAVRELTKALELDPERSVGALLHFNIANLRQEDQTGEALEEAREHYRLAVRLDDGLADAHFNLAALLVRLGYDRQAAVSFARVLEIDPDDEEAYLGRGGALVRLGMHVLARQTLEEGLRRRAGHAGLTEALARLLAASPNDDVRDGERALKLALEALEREQKARHAETVAMALAEAGRFDEAVELQRQILEQARQAGSPAALLRRLEIRLELFRQGQPYRMR